MKIPKELKIGRKKIEIKQHQTVTIGKQACKGSFHMKDNIIKIAKKDVHGNRFGKAEQSETFWHELTHAILHDMKNQLTYNEKFVVAFSKRLDQAIRTARF